MAESVVYFLLVLVFSVQAQLAFQMFSKHRVSLLRRLTQNLSTSISSHLVCARKIKYILNKLMIFLNFTIEKTINLKKI